MGTKFTADNLGNLGITGTVTANGLIIPTGATLGYVLTSGPTGVATWQASQGGTGGGITGPTGPTGPTGGILDQYRENYIVGTTSGNYNGSLDYFELVDSFVANGKNLKVYYSGALMTPGVSGAADYVELGPTGVQFNDDRVAGRNISFIWDLLA